ncbi:FAD/NAD(P)-binding protein [Pseudoclavibacter sp. VKM Ac-2867]|uniref:FAD/NAD(P)-binding protein n=1 Tax=Pseudoclavibacter sp. VKM Ac-2867 TaxID=2783829 RepID=UPI00188D10ED|nr:FAD/NAD(P)-binding protein [Pseudoclavibacter sp. VKM Ac-2867]MBF4460693.1 FAD/NAD(P)-binding protein [Pseudoclavibacter sp. VKM Ac-2867]
MFDAVIVGGGPRAVATVLRVVARRPGARIRTAIVDAIDVGAGATWRIDQPAEFLNNTTSGSTTIHADESTRMTGPIVPGPDLVDWAAAIVARGEHSTPWVLEEARAVRPGSFPSRRLQGVYFREQLAAAEASGYVELARIQGAAVDVRDDGPDARTVVLADGTELRAPIVVLAQGMVQALPSDETQRFERAARELGLVYIAPGMPAEQGWSAVPAGEDVIVRGLGANFFDVVAVLTSGRGGRFEPVADDTRGRLRYVPSGDEPILHAGSRRGVPYRAKADGWAEASPFVARTATPDWFRALAAAEPESLDFRGDVWPSIAREFAVAYLAALSGWAPHALTVSLPEALAALDDAESVSAIDDVLTASIDQRADDGAHAFTIDSLRRPTRGQQVSPERWRRQVEQLVESELGSMSSPDEHPRAAVNRAMGALRGQAARLAVSGVLEGRSAVTDFEGWFNADGLFLASGPPSGRTREVLALIDAGLLRLTGPETAVSLDVEAGEFVARSAITGIEVRARALIEPRMSKGKVPATDDPLLRALLDSGRARVHARRARDGAAVETDSMEATGANLEEGKPGLNLVRRDGSVDDRVVVLGIPALSTQPGSAIGATPRKPSPLLAGADVAARQIVRLASQQRQC